MPQANTTAGNSPTCDRKCRKLDGTLAAPVAVNIKRDKDRDKNEQPEGFGILKMQCTDIHFDSNSIIKGIPPKQSRIYKKGRGRTHDLF